MDLFPERDERRDRRLLPAALIVSILFHVAAGGAWGWFGYRFAPVVAKLLPRPTPAPELVALSDAITIEKRAVPRAAHSARSQRHRAQPRPRQLAQLPALQTPSLPTLAPVATTVPAVQPSHRSDRGTLHHPWAQPTPASAPPAAANSAFSPQQMAALDARFSKTIAQAQRALTDVPAQRRPPARAPDQPRYEAVMAGTPEQFLSAQGECVSIQLSGHAATVDRYLRCVITYSDGYFEQVSFPWAFRFSRRNDPFQFEDGSYHPFPMQPPPDGFALPHPFALSRALCSFYRAECASLIARERAAGNQPATGPP
ncbi:MAG: hypothetical protein NVS4B13_05340 [Candidatus Elarobacter sp.]